MPADASVILEDAEGNLAGIVTDGDLRRYEEVLSASARLRRWYDT